MSEIKIGSRVRLNDKAQKMFRNTPGLEGAEGRVAAVSEDNYIRVFLDNTNLHCFPQGDLYLRTEFDIL